MCFVTLHKESPDEAKRFGTVFLFRNWKTFIIEVKQHPGYNGAGVFFMRIKKTVRRMLRMCPDAWYIWISAIKLTAFILFCAFMLLLEWDGSMEQGYREYMTARSLYETGQALLLIGALFSVCIEDAHSRRE